MVPWSICSVDILIRGRFLKNIFFSFGPNTYPTLVKTKKKTFFIIFSSAEKKKQK